MKLKCPDYIKNYTGETNINLGCGRKPLEGFINCDFYTLGHEDMTVDLNKPLPFESSSANLIFSDNVFEHIKNYLELIRECHRVLKPEGRLAIRVPYFRSRHAYVDPTHINFFTLGSLDYFVKSKDAYNGYRFFDECFETLEIMINPSEKQKSVIDKAIEKYIISHPRKWEDSIVQLLYRIDTVMFILKR